MIKEGDKVRMTRNGRFIQEGMIMQVEAIVEGYHILVYDVDTGEVLTYAAKAGEWGAIDG